MARPLHRAVMALGFLFIFTAPALQIQSAAQSVSQPTDLRAGVMKVDITPPIGTLLAGYADRTEGSTGIRDPLRAAVLVLESGQDRAALVTTDLIGVGDEETAAIRVAIAERTGIHQSNILVAASHTHGSPRLDATTDYGRLVTAKIAGAAAVAAKSLEPATIGFSEDTVEYCVNRRLLNDDGIAEMRPNPDGVVDPRVRILRIDGVPADDSPAGASGTGKPIAVAIHNACHANVFRNENTLVTGDFPGVAQQVFEHALGIPSLFLQGAAGDTRPNLPSEDGFRSGTEQDVVAVGTELGATAVAAAARAGSAEGLADRPAEYPIAATVRSVTLPGKDGGSVRAELQALRIGEHLFLTIPGEPFTAYQLQVEEIIRRSHPDTHVFVVGYANGSIGYVITADAYPFGGYEPGATRLAPEAESILVDELVRLAREVL